MECGRPSDEPPTLSAHIWQSSGFYQRWSPGGSHSRPSDFTLQQWCHLVLKTTDTAWEELWTLTGADRGLIPQTGTQQLSWSSLLSQEVFNASSSQKHFNYSDTINKLWNMPTYTRIHLSFFKKNISYCCWWRFVGWGVLWWHHRQRWLAHPFKRKWLIYSLSSFLQVPELSVWNYQLINHCNTYSNLSITWVVLI